MMKLALLLMVLGLFCRVSPLVAQPADCNPEPVIAMADVPQSRIGDAFPVFSYDGRYLVFDRGFDSFTSAVYRYDRLTCHLELVSVDADGQPLIGNHGVLSSISADGRYIMIHTVYRDSSSLLLRDMEMQTTEALMLFAGTIYHHLPATSADGRYIVYAASFDPSLDFNGLFLHDRQQGESIEIISGGHALEHYVHYLPMISGDGNYIAFYSNADDLLPDDTAEGGDIFLYERSTASLTRISTGVPEHIPALSADGRYVAFYALQHDLVPDDTNKTFDAFVYDRLTGAVERVSVASDGSEGNGSSKDERIYISADGRFVVFTSLAGNLVPGDTNGTADVFVHDRETGQTKRVSVDAAGRQIDEPAAHAVISGDGRFVGFASAAADLASGNEAGEVRVFLVDWQRLPATVPAD